MSFQAIKKFVFFNSLVLTGSILGLSTVLANPVAYLKEFASSTQSATGEFQQTQMRSGGRPELSTGVFSFSRPGKFRWDIRKPFEQLLVADGNKAWFYDKDLNQVTVRKVGTALGATPAAILFGSSELEKDFNLSAAPSRQGLEWADAVPKSKEAGFEKISIGFLGVTPVTLEIRDSFGQTVTLTLRNLQRNVPIAANQFQFVAPKGADVIEQ